MSAARKPKPYYYNEPKDPNEHPLGRCSVCLLSWGHLSPCLVDHTTNERPSRLAAKAAVASMKVKKCKFKKGTGVGRQFPDGIYYHGKITKVNHAHATYHVCFRDGGLIKNINEDELDVVPEEQPAQPGDEVEEEDDVNEVEYKCTCSFDLNIVNGPCPAGEARCIGC